MAKAKVTLNQHYVASELWPQMESGVQKLLAKAAERAREQIPVGKDKARKGSAARIGYLAQPAPIMPGISNEWKSPETGGRVKAWASNVSTRTSSNVTGNPALAWKIEAFATGRKRGSEIQVPYSDVRFTRSYRGSGGRAIYDHKHLRDSLEIEVDGVGLKVIGTLTANRPYAWYVEKGTTKQPPKHYMQAGLDSIEGDIRNPAEFFGKKG